MPRFKTSTRAMLVIVFLLLIFTLSSTIAQIYNYLPGDVNMSSGAWPPQVIGGDVTYLVNYFRAIDGIAPCVFNGVWASGDVNGDCVVVGSDVTYLVNYFRGLNSIAYCTDATPSWQSSEELPPAAPSGWPNCGQVADHPPQIATISNKEVHEGGHLEFKVVSSDLDGDAISLQAEMLPEHAAFYDSTGGIGGFYFDPETGQAQIYTVRFIASSTIYADTEMVQITVTDGNQPPVLNPIGAKLVYVDSLLEFTISASDPDGITPELNAVNLPGDASFNDNNNGTGVFSWTPEQTDLGSHQVIFIASDGELADSEVVTITVNSNGVSGALIADHTFCDAADSDWIHIPEALRDTILAKFDMYYRHTSHGSQIKTGCVKISNEEGFPNFYYNIYAESDHVGEHGDTSWAPYFRSYLSSHPECNLASISWCWEHRYYTEPETQMYLDKMNELEQAFPNVIFVYQTGRRYYPSDDPELNHRRHNNQIRQYCRDNDKVLFDFADIESYDPDGNYYPNDGDGCDWCTDWCAETEHDCANDCECAHSHCFNCWQKGRAWWVMMAYLAGWNGQ